jgi:CrcB protein
LEGGNVIAGLIALVIGSALGGIARYVVSAIVARHAGETFPWGTLLVNVTGAFLIGILGARATHDASLLTQPAPWLFAVTGFLGCYTTVSSFSLQTLILAHDGKLRDALGNVVFSVGLGLAAVTAGFVLTEWLGA